MAQVLHILHRDIAYGRVRHVMRLASAMSERGYRSSVCCLAAAEKERTYLQAVAGEQSGNFTFCSQSHAFDAAFLARYSRELRKSNPDVVHFWGRERNSAVHVANRIFGNRPLVTTLDHEPCVVCIPSDPQSSEQRSNSSLRDHLGLANDAIVVAVRTDLRLPNRGKDLIWALDCLRVLRRNVFLVFFGDGDYKQQLQEYSARANADDGVVFFVSAGELNSSEWFAECDFFWNAEANDNLVSVVEAMHMGIPVIAADTVATRSAIVDQETGYLVPVGDAAEFARRTNVLLDDAALVERIRSAASDRSTEQFGVEAMLQHYVGMYDGVSPNSSEQAVSKPAA